MQSTNYDVKLLARANKLSYHQVHILALAVDTNTSEMLVTMGSVQLEEFYPAVAVSALMRIVRDPSLSSHHTMVIQVHKSWFALVCITASRCFT